MYATAWRSRRARRTLVLLAAVLAWAWGSAPVAADGECTATCSCPCVADYGDCAAFCTTGYFAQCRNGFCGGGASSCCCILQGPLRPTRTCSGADCGNASISCASLRSRPEKGACLDLMGSPSIEARWLLLESEPIVGARDHRLHVMFASSPRFKEQIEGCHRQGLLPDSLFDGGVSRTFRFIPPLGTFPMSGRRMRLNVPASDLGGLAGQLAIRLVVDAQGAVQSKDLLFSTDERLGQLALDGIDRWMEILGRGDTAGPYLDVAYLGFGPDGLEVMLQNHYSLTARDTKAGSASSR